MNKNEIIFTILIFLFWSKFSFGTCAVAYSLSGNRYGDNCVAYCHARYLSLKNKVPFYYLPFKYSDKLQMHTLHKHVNEARSIYADIITYPTWPEMGHKVDELALDKESNTLYIIPYFPACVEEAERLQLWHFSIDWRDDEFKRTLRKEISPVVQVEPLVLPHDRQSVAVHVRKGGDFDRLFQTIKRGTFNADTLAPLKFPPDTFYIEYIKKVSEFFDDKPLYVHIFTDDPDPGSLVTYYESQVNKPNIIFGCRKTGNRHDTNVLEDFFGMMQFDVMIRAESSYSIIASKLGNFKLIIYPAHFAWHENELIITDVHIESNWTED